MFYSVIPCVVIVIVLLLPSPLPYTLLVTACPIRCGTALTTLSLSVPFFTRLFLTQLISLLHLFISPLPLSSSLHLLLSLSPSPPNSKSQTGVSGSNGNSGKFTHASDPSIVDHVSLSLSNLYVSVSLALSVFSPSESIGAYTRVCVFLRVLLCVFEGHTDVAWSATAFDREFSTPWRLF